MQSSEPPNLFRIGFRVTASSLSRPKPNFHIVWIVPGLFHFVLIGAASEGVLFVGRASLKRVFVPSTKARYGFLFDLSRFCENLREPNFRKRKWGRFGKKAPQIELRVSEVDIDYVATVARQFTKVPFCPPSSVSHCWDFCVCVASLGGVGKARVL